MLFFCFVFILVFYFLVFLSSSYFSFFNKNTSFESGFLSVGIVQNSFSIHFFVIMIMFVIFDLEVVMFLGFLVSDFGGFLVFCYFWFFVIFGFYMEWYYSKLVWSF